MSLTYKSTIQNSMRRISALAMGLHGSGSPDAHKIFALTPTAIGINLLSMIRSRSPRVGRLLTSIAPFVVLCIAFVKLLGTGKALSWILMHIRAKLMATITVPEGHTLLEPVKKWMTGQGMKTNARKLTLKPGEVLPYYARRRGRDGDDDDDDDEEKRDLLECQPNLGRYFFRFNGRLLVFNVQAKKVKQSSSTAQVIVARGGSEDLEVSISCFSVLAGTGPVHEFLEHIKAVHEASKQGSTTIHRPHCTKKGLGWAGTPLVQDMESYLSKETEVFYASRGIPLRRGYMLYGPPGTGKSSFSAAIAGYFKLGLFGVNLTTPGLSDKGLETLFDALPARCIVLLEDIDSAGIQRENIREASKPSAEAKVSEKACVTLSGLLNVLDGPCSTERRLVIMTSNNPDSLDPAMVHPGRIDMKVYLGNASTEVLATMFKHIFIRKSQECDDKASAIRNEYISRLAGTFASSVPSDVLGPAEVQGYLMVHRNDPETAVQKAKQWAAEVIEIRALGNNVATPNDVVASAGDVVAETENVGGPTDVFAEAENANDRSNDEIFDADDDDSSDNEESDAESDSSLDTPPPSEESE